MKQKDIEVIRKRLSEIEAKLGIPSPDVISTIL